MTSAASISPDLRTMVSVGDSTDVFLFEVIDGGKEFKRIGVYTGASDAGFSTAWSKDGRKFAVASQGEDLLSWLKRGIEQFRRTGHSLGSSVQQAPRHLPHLIFDI